MEDQSLINQIKKVSEAFTYLKSQLNTTTTRSIKLMEQNETLQLKDIADVILEYQVILEDIRTYGEENEKLKQYISERLNHSITKIATIEDQLIQLKQHYEEVQCRNKQENTELNHCLVNANREVEEISQTITPLKKQLLETALDVDKLHQSLENSSLELDQSSLNRDTLVETLQRNKTQVAANKVLKENSIEALKENDALQTKSSEKDKLIREFQNHLSTHLLQMRQIATLCDNLNKIKGLDENLALATSNLEETSNKKDEVINKNVELYVEVENFTQDAQNRNRKVMGNVGKDDGNCNAAEGGASESVEAE